MDRPQMPGQPITINTPWGSARVHHDPMLSGDSCVAAELAGTETSFGPMNLRFGIHDGLESPPRLRVSLGSDMVGIENAWMVNCEVDLATGGIAAGTQPGAITALKDIRTAAVEHATQILGEAAADDPTYAARIYVALAKAQASRLDWNVEALRTALEKAMSRRDAFLASAVEAEGIVADQEPSDTRILGA